MTEQKIRRLWIKSDKYKGTTPEVIEKLANDGYDTTWYSKAKRLPDARLKTGTECSFFTVYIADGEWVYTKNTGTGTKYQQYRKLTKNFAAKETWFCEICKGKWPSWSEAEQHYESGPEAHNQPS